MTDVEAREYVYQNLSEVYRTPECKINQIVLSFAERSFRYDPDLENLLVEELYNVAAACSLKWYDGLYYIFDGKIYVTVSLEAVMSAFKLWLMRVGLKISQKRKTELFKNEFLPSVKMNNKLVPRLDIVAFSNGVLDMSNFTLYAFSPEFHVMYYHPYEYNPKAKCPKWNTFLHEILPDQRSRIILQMFLGLGLIERGTVYNQYEGKDRPKIELCLILIGEGSNGKSVIYQTAMGIFGRSRISGVDYDELTSGGDEGMRSRRLLREAIFNWSSDSDSRTFGRKRTGVFKRIVSGEPVTDREIGGNVKQNFSLPYLIFNINELPYPDDASLGFIRRLQFISFDVIIPKHKQNKTLAQELVKEYSGIFNWILRGTKEIRRRKFIFPDSEGGRRQLLMTQGYANPVIAWVNSYRVRSIPQANNELYIEISAKDIIASIADFCEDNGFTMPSQQQIGRTLANLAFMKHRSATGMIYKVYGITESDICEPFVIRDECFNFEDEDKDTYIDVND